MRWPWPLRATGRPSRCATGWRPRPMPTGRPRRRRRRRSTHPRTGARGTRWPDPVASCTNCSPEAFEAAQRAVAAVTDDGLARAICRRPPPWLSPWPRPARSLVGNVGDSRAYWLASRRSIGGFSRWTTRGPKSGSPKGMDAAGGLRRIPRRTPSPVGSAPTPSRPNPAITDFEVTEPGLLSSAPTGSGTTSTSLSSWRSWSPPREPTPRPSGIARLPGRRRPRRRRPGQHHRRGSPGRTGATTPAAPKRGVTRAMAEFDIECFQNEFLPEGADVMNAVITVSAKGHLAPAGGVWSQVPGSGRDDPRRHLGLDEGSEARREAKVATAVAIDCLPDGVRFAVVTGNHEAEMAYPSAPAVGRRHRPVTRGEAKEAVRTSRGPRGNGHRLVDQADRPSAPGRARDHGTPSC